MLYNKKTEPLVQVRLSVKYEDHEAYFEDRCLTGDPANRQINRQTLYLKSWGFGSSDHRCSSGSNRKEKNVKEICI